jgi:hypothetical protein
MYSTEGMEKLVPDLEKYLIHGSGHWTPQESPEAVSASSSNGGEDDLDERSLGTRWKTARRYRFSAGRVSVRNELRRPTISKIDRPYHGK